MGTVNNVLGGPVGSISCSELNESKNLWALFRSLDVTPPFLPVLFVEIEGSFHFIWKARLHGNSLERFSALQSLLASPSAPLMNGPSV